MFTYMLMLMLMLVHIPGARGTQLCIQDGMQKPVRKALQERIDRERKPKKLRFVIKQHTKQEQINQRGLSSFYRYAPGFPRLPLFSMSLSASACRASNSDMSVSARRTGGIVCIGARWAGNE